MAKTKKKAEFQHACRRARERFGLDFKQHDIETIVRMIRKEDGVFLYRQSTRVSHWLIHYRGANMIACYDKDRNMVITFLTVEMYDIGRYTTCQHIGRKVREALNGITFANIPAESAAN